MSFFDITLISANQLSGQEIIDLSRLRVNRRRGQNNTRPLKPLLRGPLINHISLQNESIQIEVRLLRSAGNQLQQTAFRVQRQPFCQFYFNDTIFVPEFIAASDLPPQTSCPVENVCSNLK
jgi:hypothetical protein